MKIRNHSEEKQEENRNKMDESGFRVDKHVSKGYVRRVDAPQLYINGKGPSDMLTGENSEKRLNAVILSIRLHESLTRAVKSI
jgi:hypothetical protein